jgi:putative nucleotidyltransferase with HDIG domain
MSPSPRLSAYGRTYVSAVILLGFTVITSSVFELVQAPVSSQWLVLAALTLISGSATVKLPSVPASISISEVFVFAAVLLYGPAAGTLTVALDGLVISYWIAKRRKEPYRALFNMSAPAVSAWCSAEFFFWASDLVPLGLVAPAAAGGAPVILNRLLPWLFLFAALYFLLNSGLIAIIIAIETRVPAFKVWRQNFIWLSLNYFCGASVAMLLVVYTGQVDLRFLGVTVPLLLVLYFVFKISMEKVEDANRHVESLNRLYVSTIETLAMAIDAKDQVTHGHIRRVQKHAVALAKELGVRNPGLIKAIEAAALLHDMGKLAVPEHILNKPGRLTKAEFEKMKSHASIGADILSAVDFPYPVVPIVRHHHESWDGTGYPDGVKGADIPVGARILAVVDCFDALTSDRPYRKRLSDKEAIDILKQRRGTMYDPLVVDTFVRVYEAFERDQGFGSGLADPANPQETHQPQAVDVERHSRPGRQTTLAFSSSSNPGAVFNPQLLRGPEFAETLVMKIARSFPSTLVIFYCYDPGSDVLIATNVMGQDAEKLKGLTIGRGERLTGWVAANIRPILNSDPALDLQDLLAGFSLRLRTSMSVPVVINGTLAGVVTLYCPDPKGYDPQHQGSVEDICKAVIPTEATYPLLLVNSS